MQIILSIIKVSRPIHWVKNVSLFAALIFSGLLFSVHQFQSVIVAFFAFGFATSSTYIFNDILDVKRHRLHPIKRNRPIANGTLPVPDAVFTLISFILLPLLLSPGLPPVILSSS